MTLSEFILAFKALEKETKGRCFYCGVQTERSGLKPHNAIYQTRDHVIPISAKGWDRRANKVVCCRRCNSLKEDLTLIEFKRRMSLTVFYAEELLGARIEGLTDIESVNTHVINTRRVEGRSIKFNGKLEVRARVTKDFLPSATPDPSNQQ
jgi:hypothetical protein